jgi:CrcB protein
VPASPDDDAVRPVDPDVDLTDPVQRSESDWLLLAAIAVGGVLGAETRYAVGRLIVHHGSSFPWSTVVINAVGAALLGVLMAVVDARAVHRLLRPFVGVGILGGFTTFSTFAVDVDTLLHDHRPALALGYLVLTVLGCLVAVIAAYRAMSALVRQP